MCVLKSIFNWHTKKCANITDCTYAIGNYDIHLENFVVQTKYV
jgi:hypothetical protein